MVKLLITDKTYTPKKDETLEAIVKAECPDITWNQLALFNWGTEEAVEVNRALFEIVGCSKIETDPSKTVLDPDRGTTKDITIPKLWSGEAEFDKLTTIKVKKKTPAPAVGIPALDKWFIPKTEHCVIRYQLEGLEAYADKLALEVHGSNYCKATAWNDGLGTFAAVAGEPVYKRKPDDIAISERSSGKIGGWRGEADAGDGLLKGKDRLLNVAFSPYTVLFRYYKDDGDKDARLLIKPFWPQFDLTAADKPVVAASLKIEWEVSGIARLKHGTLLVVDRDDKVIYRRAIPEAKLAAGAQSIDDWDGKYNWDDENNCAAAPAAGKVALGRMPYRVQIQGHTGVGDANGVALAAMHTEVRLYVNPRMRFASEENYDPITEPQSFAFALSDFIPDEKPKVEKPAAGAAANVERKYAQYQLAKAGYHPGPVDGIDRPAFQVAMKEFKRSRAKKRTGLFADYDRFPPPYDASIGAAELDALDNLPDGYLSWFAESAEGGDGPGSLDDLKTEKAFEILQDPTREVNVWVDDRQYYDISGVAVIDNEPAALGNPRGGMGIGDGKTDMDADCIPRPWIPLRIQLPLLGRDYSLDDELSERQQRNSVQPEAIGPVRVDWAFDEAGPDVSNIPADYKDASVAGEVRSKAFLTWMLDKKKEAAYQRKDLKRNVDYTNCPEDLGGIRPTAIADYYSKALGVKADGLSPWYAGEDAAHDSVVTVAHSNWGGDVQAADQLFPNALGAAGAYFNPSNIAGDGYRVRARVRFADGGGFTFANHAALEARYPKVPQANTAKMRLWRKSWLRGYIRWTNKSTGNWPKLAGTAGIQKYYDAAHVHVIHAEDKEKSWNVKDLFSFSSSDIDTVKTLVENSLQTAAFTDKVYAGYEAPDFLKTQAKMTIDPEYLWPWVRARCLGWEAAIPAAVGDAEIDDKFFDPEIFNVWRTFRMPLIFELIKRVEKKSGRMKGHLLVEFENAPKLWAAKYWCNECGQEFRFLERTEKAGDAQGLPCPNPAGCTGRMTQVAAGGGTDFTGLYLCDTCEVERKKKDDDNTGTAFNGTVCNRGIIWKCKGTLTAVTAYLEQYVCAKCNQGVVFDEPNFSGGTHVGDACSDPDCHGIVQRQNGNWERYVCPKPKCATTAVMPDGVLGHSSAVCPSCGKPLGHRVAGGPDTLVQPGWLFLGTTPPKPTKKSGSFVSFDGFGVPAVGSLCGATWLFTSGEAIVWAHEMGHHRHLEHAANAPGFKDTQHDHRNNPAIAVGDAAKEQQWDLHCMMNGYSTTDHPEREFDFPCGKCLLKQRGWKVEGLPLPASGVTD
jgi:hypothetical protein